MTNAQHISTSRPTDGFLILAAQHAAQKSAKRQADRKRIHTQVVYPIDTPRLIRDPLVRHESRLVSTITTTRLLISAVVIHLLIIIFFFFVNQLIGKHSASLPSEKVKVRIVEVTPPEKEPPEVEELAAIKGPVQPDFTPKKTEPIEPRKPKKQKRIEPPTEQEAETAPEPDQPVRHRIVGLSLESTVQGSSGPSFAIGTSRMGKTERRAMDPNLASREPPDEGTGTGTVREQRVATNIPTRDSVFIKPKRLKPSAPPFPPVLKAQGIEGDVKVRVDLDETGRVIRVTILQSSGHPAFDETARKAALAEVFSPALRDGKPVAHTFSYTYRFRIEDD